MNYKLSKLIEKPNIEESLPLFLKRKSWDCFI